MTPLKSLNVENASAVHNAIMSVSEAYGRQLATLSQEIAQLRQELAVANGRLAANEAAAANKKEPPATCAPPPAHEPGSEL